MTGVLRDRLEQVARAGDRIVLAAAGSSDKRALREVELAARWFARICGGTVELAYLSAAEPRVADVVAGTAETTRAASCAGTANTAAALPAQPIQPSVRRTQSSCPICWLRLRGSSSARRPDRVHESRPVCSAPTRR